MGFTQAVNTCLGKYATFSGRASRSEYWFFVLFNILATMVAAIVDVVVFNLVLGLGFMPLYFIAAIGLILPGLAVAVRRLHDVGRSGWWFFIALVPLVGPILLLIWFCTAGKEETNQFGPDPLPSRGMGGLSPAV